MKLACILQIEYIEVLNSSIWEVLKPDDQCGKLY